MPVARKPIPTAVEVPTIPGTERLSPSRPRRPGTLPPGREMLFWSATYPNIDPHYSEDLFGVMPRTGVVRRLTDDNASDRDPDWGPRRRRIVSEREDGADPPYLTIRDRAGTLIRTIDVPASQPIWTAAFGILACVWGTGDRTDIACIGMTGQVRNVTAAQPGENLYSPAWHPTAGLLATLDTSNMSTSSTQLVHATAAAVTTAITTGTPIPVSAMTPLGAAGSSNSSGSSWSPDGLRIAYVTPRPCATTQAGVPINQLDIAIMSLASGPVQLITDDSAGTYDDGLNDDSPVFSPDGQWLAWCRGYEDGWAQIILQRLDNPSSRRVLVADTHRYRAGLCW